MPLPNVTSEIFDGQLRQVPTEVRYCQRCVVSNQRPRITFDENDVCSACLFAEEKHSSIDWGARDAELIALLDKYRSRDGSFDVVVPSSGGKDSALVAYKLKHQYGMHPLTVTWAPYLYTDIGWQNFLRFKDAGFENILGFPDGKLNRKLALLAFDLLGDPWDPFVYGQMSWPFRMAAKFDIQLVFYGENGDLEYGGTTKNKNKAGEPIQDWKDIYFKGTTIDVLVEQGLKRGVLQRDEVRPKSLEFYKLPPLGSDVQMHWWSYYHKWMPQEHYYFAVEHTGFRANPSRSEGTFTKYASLDDKTDGFHYYLGFIKFGLGRATSDAAQEIRDGHITRDEGVALVKRFDGEFPKRYFQEFLTYLGISEREFSFVCDKFRQAHIWKREGSEWALRQPISD